MSEIINITKNWTGLKIDKNTDTTSIREQIYVNGEFLIKGMDFWSQFSYEQIYLFMAQDGLYVLPTEELIDFLDNLIGDKSAIEIGAGRGFVARELDIPATDSYQQQDDKMSVMLYDLMKQPRIRYPKWVEKKDAIAAVLKYRPHTVIGCYVTHKWRNDTMSGNQKGIDMQRMFSFVERFILVGNKSTHKDNPLMDIPHQEIELDGLITKSAYPDLNRIFIWEKR